MNMETNDQRLSRTVAIIQARMKSTRLPGKVLLEIAGKPMLGHVVERARRSASLDEVIVATTTDPSDDPVQAYCDRSGYPFFRGSPKDVLDRYYQCARAFDAGTIVRITADCPVIDPGVIDHTVHEFRVKQADFAANRFPPPWKRTFPLGLDTEVCTFKALEEAWESATEPHHREHVMPYLYEHPEKYKIVLVDHDPDYGTLRWTVDTPQDLDVIRLIFQKMAHKPDFTWLDLLELYQREPELAEMNKDIHHKHYREIDQQR